MCTFNKNLHNLKTNKTYKIIVRPHPQEVRHFKEKFDRLQEKYKNNKNIEIQTDFSKNDTVFKADMLITDWSSIGYEYAYTTKKPVVFINTPMKIMNPNYKDIDVEPINIWSRDIIGKSLDVNSLVKINETIEYLFKNEKKYAKEIEKLLNDSIYNLGKSAEKGALYLVDIVKESIEKRKKENEKNK